MTNARTWAAVVLVSAMSLPSVALVACGGSDASGGDDGSGSDASVANGHDGGTTGRPGAGTAADGGGSAVGGGNGGNGGTSGDGGDGVDGAALSDAGRSADGGGSGGGSGAGSAGCGVKTAEAGTFTVNLTLDGGARSYDVVVPAAYKPGVPAPLAFVFHGAGGSSKQAEGYGLQEAAAAANQPGIFAFPQGTTNYGSATGWDDFSCTSPDTALFDAIVTRLEADYCIAPDRIFATGFSWGGDFTNVLGSCRGSVLRAVASGSGGFYIKATAEDVAYRFTYGTKDNEYSQAQFAMALKEFHDANHCGSATTSSDPSPCLAYSGCDHPVVSCSYEGMGHQLPSGWGTDTWAFFASFH
jgi:polyhydroxybutyrate depolymerase